MLNSAMQLSIISYIRNEANILESFVRHHARLAENIIVVLRSSEDGTDSILSSLQQEGLPLIILPDMEQEFRQAEALQEAFSLAISEEPQWILPLDADEFLIGDITVPEALARLPSNAITLLPWKTFVPTVKDDPTETNVLRRIRHRRSEEVQPFWKALIPSPLFDRARLQTGNHSVLDLPTNEPLPAVRSSSLSLAHFPVRTVAQIQRKIDTDWTGLVLHASSEQGYHWRDLHARFVVHTPTKADLTNIALRYALQEDDLTPGLVCEPIS